jgi:uncharacterized protein
VLRYAKFVSMTVVLSICGLEVAPAASFPCEKAATSVEKSICANATVSALDEHMGRYYAAARTELGAAKNCLATNQREWLRTVRNACTDAKCLERAYLARLAELDALQPGATALRNVELPRVKSLVWIIPEADDTVAAPRNPKAPALVAQGQIVDEVADGDGFVLRVDSGKKHVLLPLMFMNEASSTMLQSLAREPGSRYEARGRRESSDDAVHFAPGACTLIYRLPRASGS